MSYVFVVVAVSDSEVQVCEAFSGLAALGRAFQLASDKSGRGRTDLFTHSPSEETLPDGSRRWVFMDTGTQSVVVFYREVADALMDSRDPNNLIGGLPNNKNVPRDTIPFGLSPVEHKVVSVIPARGSLHGAPIHDTPKPINIKNDFKWIDASEHIKDGLPYGAGGNLAKALLDMNLTKDEWTRIVIDITKLPTELVISSFFNAFMQMISDHDQTLLDIIKNDVSLYANFDFQYDNILSWITDFKPLPPPFDIMARVLPAGWNVDEKPITMGEFLDCPADAKNPLLELTEEQKWALVKARVRKSPHFAVDLSGYVPSRDDALKALESRTDLGLKIRNADIKRLHDLLCELMDV